MNHKKHFVIGADGVRGDTPPLPIKADNEKLGFKCQDRQTFVFGNGTQYTNYTCLGKSGLHAGNGGNGGCGGFGGDPGRSYIVGLKNPTNIKVYNNSGDQLNTSTNIYLCFRD